MDKTSEATPSIYWLLPDRFDTRQDKSSWLEMARGLAAHGWRTKIVATRADAASSDYDGIVHYLPALNIPFFFRWILITQSFWYVARQSKPGDIVLINQECLWLLPLLRLQQGRRVHLDIRTIPLVSRSGLKNRLDYWLFWVLPMKLFAHRVDSHSFITEPLKQEVTRAFGLDPAEYSIWQSGVNTSLFRPCPTTITPASGPKAFHLFYHGGLLSTRGIDLVLEAIASRAFPFDLRFTIVGDGPDRSSLESLAIKLGLEAQVHFTGFVPYERIPELIAGADCCICPLPDMPEWRVSSPLKVLEYLACGKRIILTPLEAHKHAAGGLPGVVWSADFSPAGIAEAILQAQASGPLSAADARDVRQYVIEHFEWTAHARVLHNQLDTRQRED